MQGELMRVETRSKCPRTGNPGGRDGFYKGGSETGGHAAQSQILELGQGGE